MPRLSPVAALLAALAVAPAATTAVAHAESLTWLGQNTLPTTTLYAGTVVGGLSGIDFVAATGRYVAISDDRSQFNPARFYELSLDFSQFSRSNTPGGAGIAFDAVTTIQRPDGSAFPAFGVDPESIRFNRHTGRLLWSNEGQRGAAGFQNPTVREMTPAGAFTREFGVPAAFNPVGSNGGNTLGDAGIRNNLAFESLTVSPDGSRAYVATENALAQDGPAAGVGVPSASRVIAFDTATGAAVAQYAYVVEPVAAEPVPTGSFATNGLVELLATDDAGRFIAVERSFSTGVGNAIRLYEVSTIGATDVSSFASLAAGGFTPMSKSLLLDLTTLRTDDGQPVVLDNIEGVTFGPAFGGYAKTLVLVSDNNFSPTQFTQVMAFGVGQPVPEPGTWALMAAGVAGLWLARRRR